MLHHTVLERALGQQPHQGQRLDLPSGPWREEVVAPHWWSQGKGAMVRHGVKQS